MPTDLPVPVEPAISRCGIAARSATYGSPWIVLPSAIVSFGGRPAVDLGLEQLAQRNLLARAVGNLDADGRLAGDAIDQHRLGLHREAEVVGEAGDLRVLHAGVRLELEGRDDRARMDLDDAAFDRELAALSPRAGARRPSARARRSCARSSARRAAPAAAARSRPCGARRAPWRAAPDRPAAAAARAWSPSAASAARTIWRCQTPARRRARRRASRVRPASRRPGRSGFEQPRRPGDRRRPPFFVCFAMTSRRCFSRRRSSRHARNDPIAFAPPSRAPSMTAPKKRPNENCVDMMIARKISVRMTIIEPVRLR